MSVKEQIIKVREQIFAAKVWYEGQGLPILALHGWLDNAASFDLLAPYLKQYLVAIDLPGHGYSSHKPVGHILHLSDLIIEISELIIHLGWQKFILLGHSLGAAVASLLAGVLPEKIAALVLIDGLGPPTLPAEKAPFAMRRFLQETSISKTPPQYKSFEAAMEARLQVNIIERTGLQHIVERGLRKLDNGMWTWRTDPRLLQPSSLYFTEQQVIAFLQQITAPVCFIRPEPGYPFHIEVMAQRLKALTEATKVQIVRLEGCHHHVHLDHPEKVALSLHSFFNNIARNLVN